MLPTLRGTSGDVVTVYVYYDTKARFLQSLALPSERSAKDAKCLFPPTMAHMSEWAGTQPAAPALHLGQLKNGNLGKSFF